MHSLTWRPIEKRPISKDSNFTQYKFITIISWGGDKGEYDYTITTFDLSLVPSFDHDLARDPKSSFAVLWTTKFSFFGEVLNFYVPMNLYYRENILREGINWGNTKSLQLLLLHSSYKFKNFDRKVWIPCGSAAVIVCPSLICHISSWWYFRTILNHFISICINH